MALYRLAYARSSTEKQDLDYQVVQFEKLGYDEMFVEKLSGRRRDRPQFDALTERAIELRHQGHDVTVFVCEWTRWARDTAFALDSLDRLEKIGCSVVEATTGQSVTMQTPDGLITTGLKSLVAHEFSVRLSSRMKSNYAYRQSVGKVGSNRAPFGYRYTPEKLVPSEQWAIARDMVERFINGQTSTDICRWLQQEHGISRSVNGVSQWLQHPALRGHLRYPDGSIAYDCHEPVMSEGEWKQVKYRLDLNRSLRGVNKGRIHAIPNGIIRCDACGYGTVPSISQYKGKKRTIINRYFYCKKAALEQCSAPRMGCREDWIEAAIQNAIQEQAEKAADAVEAAEQDTLDPRIAIKQAELDKLEPLRHLTGIPQAIAALQAEIAQIKSASTIAEADDTERKRLIQNLADATPEEWAMLSAEERRAIYAELVREVRVLGAEVVGVWLG